MKEDLNNYARVAVVSILSLPVPFSVENGLSPQTKVSSISMFVEM